MGSAIDNKEWKKFLLTEEKELNYQTRCRITYDKERRNQTYVLNDVREIIGVRVVTIIEPVRIHGGLEEVGVLIKYDPQLGATLRSYMPKLKRLIKSIDGVSTVKFYETEKTWV